MIKIITASELMRDWHPPTDEERGFTIDDEWLTIRWGNHDYEIELSRINTPVKALGWIAHLGPKGWKGTTPERIAMLIEKLAVRFNWPIHPL